MPLGMPDMDIAPLLIGDQHTYRLCKTTAQEEDCVNYSRGPCQQLYRLTGSWGYKELRHFRPTDQLGFMITVHTKARPAQLVWQTSRIAQAEQADSNAGVA